MKKSVRNMLASADDDALIRFTASTYDLFNGIHNMLKHMSSDKLKELGVRQKTDGEGDFYHLETMYNGIPYTYTIRKIEAQCTFRVERGKVDGALKDGEQSFVAPTIAVDVKKSNFRIIVHSDDEKGKLQGLAEVSSAQTGDLCVVNNMPKKGKIPKSVFADTMIACAAPHVQRFLDALKIQLTVKLPSVVTALKPKDVKGSKGQKPSMPKR